MSDVTEMMKLEALRIGPFTEVAIKLVKTDTIMFFRTLESNLKKENPYNNREINEGGDC